MESNSAFWINNAIDAFKKGNLPQAENFCRLLLEHDVKQPVVYELLGHIASRVRRYDQTLHYFQCVLDIDPNYQPAINAKAEASKALEQERRTEGNTRETYLLIKAWGSGFWSDVDHVIGQLLLAEITGRIPIVYWSKASLFSDGSGKNAFENFFEPLSEYSIDDIASPELSYYPPKWSVANLYRDGVNKYSGAYSRMAALYFLNRPEDVVVSDFHTYVSDLMPWIPPGHPLHGYDCESLYRYLFAKYLRIKPDVGEEIESFYQENLAGKICLAVHARGSDKQLECDNLAEVNASYHKAIEEYLDKEPGLSIFLLTDYKPYLDEYHARYQGRIITTECARTSSDTGVHYLTQNNKVRNGIEVMKDVYLAAKCKYFIGNGRSNVSIAILHMKDWQEGHYTLFGSNMMNGPHLFLHNW